MYMSKIVSRSFIISAKNDSVFGCSNYLYWVSCLVVFFKENQKKQCGFLHKSETRNRKNY